IIIGFDWLRKHNPLVDWRTGHIVFNRCPSPCLSNFQNKEPEELDARKRRILKSIDLEEGDRILVTKFQPELPEDEYWRELREKQEVASQKLAEKALQEKSGAPLDTIMPKYLEDFAPVFEKASFDRLPE
ncbi:hypothetical protein M405DRAFT_716338, partial [Rhizopogon salebrosus TDB-379]